MTPLQILTLHILDHASEFEWSVQGFGMLRLYIRKIGRLHIWDRRLRYPGVSMVHNHSWDLRSTIISGSLTNIIYVPTQAGGQMYAGKRLITGYHTTDVHPLEPVRLTGKKRYYLPGEIYEQQASVIHETDAEDGTITLMEREDNEQGQADVYWPAGTEWGTARPHRARPDEIVPIVASALDRLVSGR